MYTRTSASCWTNDLELINLFSTTQSNEEYPGQKLSVMIREVWRLMDRERRLCLDGITRGLAQN